MATKVKKMPRKRSPKKPTPLVVKKPTPVGYPLVKKTEPFITVSDNYSFWKPIIFVIAAISIGYGAFHFKDKVNTYINEYKNRLTVVSEIPVTKSQITSKKDLSELVKVKEVRKFYLSAVRADDKIELRTGGSSGWRYHNPGKMIHGDFTRMMGALGSDGEIAIFPSYEIGRKAMETYLFTDASTYKDMTIEEAFKKYAVADLTKATGASKQTLLKDLSDDQKKKLLDAIQKAEKWLEGKVTVFENEADFKERGW